MDYSEQREQHIEDTRYTQWSDGMYVMIENLKCDYELAVVENSLRDSVYFDIEHYFDLECEEDCIGVDGKCAGFWWAEDLKLNLTRAQALYIATGETNI